MEGVWVPEAAEALLSSRSLLSPHPLVNNLYTWSIQLYAGRKKMDDEDQCQLPRSHYPSPVGPRSARGTITWSLASA
mgnify:CR=1 FL=1